MWVLATQLLAKPPPGLPLGRGGAKQNICYVKKSLRPLSESLLNERFETERLEDRNEGTAQRQVFAAVAVAAEKVPASGSAQ
ncbi:hypothetical protein BV494_07440 [Rahnella sikkimica]|uniref:Uncharacterized protein n=1 Tax=Rahnella sikkimica TaxID=1805933 RepID=A0A2L1UPB4_9GAMM|nr:hypothetical protein BV494_07440 [Rahnella sikkimica]